MVAPPSALTAAFRQGNLPVENPPGYRSGTVPTSGFYPWARLSGLDRSPQAQDDARDPGGQPPEGGPGGHLARARGTRSSSSSRWPGSACSAPEQQTDFAQRLTQAPNAVVVWIPGEVGPDPEFKLDQLEPVIREHYHPDARFGAIEVSDAQGRVHSRPLNRSSRTEQAAPPSPRLLRIQAEPRGETHAAGVWRGRSTKDAASSPDHREERGVFDRGRAHAIVDARFVRRSEAHYFFMMGLSALTGSFEAERGRRGGCGVGRRGGEGALRRSPQPPWRSAPGRPKVRRSPKVFIGRSSLRNNIVIKQAEVARPEHRPGERAEIAGGPRRRIQPYGDRSVQDQ